jgi:hypothetical protein
VTVEVLPASSAWNRLLRGGVPLTRFERFLLAGLVQHVPAELAAAIRQQWRGLNLIQRGVDWKEVNFYRLVRGRVDREGLPRLPVRDGEVKLLSLALQPAGNAAMLHVNFWSVDGWFFNFNADRSLEPFRDADAMDVASVEHSYRSNLMGRGV